MLKKLNSKITTLISNKIIKNYIWVFLGQNIGTVFSMLSMIVTLRIISAFEYGSLVIVQTYCLLISNIFCIRTFNGFIKFATEAEGKGDYDLVKKYINSSLILDLVAGIIAFIFGFLLLKPVTFLMEWDIETVKYVGLYLAVCIFYPILNGIPTGILRKLNYFKEANEIHAFVYGLQTLVLLITLIFQVRSLPIILIEYACTEILESVILLIVAFIILQKNDLYKNFWKCGLAHDVKFVKYNISYGLLSTFDQILSNLSTLLINKYIGNLATTYLKIITRICSIFSKITNPISQVIYPELCEWITQKKYKKALEFSLKYCVIIFGIGMIAFGALFGTYDYWIRIFDAGMGQAKNQSMLYLLYSFLAISMICVHQLSLAMGMMKLNLFLAAFFDSLYLICLIPCVKKWGVIGYLVLQIVQLLVVAMVKVFFVFKKVNKIEKNNT